MRHITIAQLFATNLMTKSGLIAFLLVFAACCVCAQTTYQGITLDRGKGDETNCIYIYNENADSCFVIIQYKIGDRYTNWIDYPIDSLIPPSPNPQKVGCIDSTIIGLKLVDVKVMRSHHNSKPNTQKQKSFCQKLKALFTINK